MLLIQLQSFGQIVKAEYFFNTDPGPGNATPLVISSPGDNVAFTTSIPTTGLPKGFHFLAIRVFQSGGIWGQFEARGFYISTATIDSPIITSAEYFFDSDPGTGSGIPIPVTPGATTNFTIGIPATALSPGFHFLAIRTKGADNHWGIFESRGFYITTSTADVAIINRAEYFFDTDPGPGNGLPISVPSGATSNFTVGLPASGLSTGFHFLAVRTRDANGKWGLFESRGFYVSSSSLNSADIVAAEYFVDTDPGNGNGLALTVNPSGPSINQIFPITLTGVPSGAHTLGIRVKDSKGIWSQPQVENFSVLACTPPPAPTASSESRCDNGTLTLTANGAGTGQAYRWYGNATTSTVLFTGASFTTPVLTTSTSYFVSVYDPATLCESSRVTVAANIGPVIKPVLNATGTITLCDGVNFTLAAPSGFASYLWSNGLTTQQIPVTTNGVYSVIVGNGTCVSPSSDATTFVFTAKPTKPIVQTSGSTTLCDAGTVSLLAPAGFTYQWSNGATTQQITVNSSGSYSVITTNGTGCRSDESTPILVSAFTRPIKPVVTVLGNNVLCGSNTAGLLAPSGFLVYQWSTGQTSQGISTATAGTFQVSVGNASTCMSPSSDQIVILSTNQPCDGGIPNPNNKAPVIAPAEISTVIKGTVTLPLADLLSDPDNNLDISSLRIVKALPSGANAFINSQHELVIDYSAVSFSGIEALTLQVCDLNVACTQQQILVEVNGSINAYNAVSPNGDGKNDYLMLEYIDVIPTTISNKVTIYNRWGDEVFSVNDYNNSTRVFAGLAKDGGLLPTGTYFYKIALSDGSKTLTGFIDLKY